VSSLTAPFLDVINDDSRQPSPVEAGAVAGMAGDTFLMNLHQHGVAVAVEPHLADPLPMATGLTLHPILAATAGEKGGAPCGQCFVQGHVVHPAHHQDLSGALFLDDRRHQSGRVALEQRGHGRVEHAACGS
jgi:hypothetical protein